jgi:hypothetical protein
MKKNFLLHYIFAQPNRTTFSSQNKKRVIVENEADLELDFRDKCIDVMESFNYFCKNNSKNFCHLFLPMNENYTRPSETVHGDLSCGLLQIMLFNFTRDNFKTYSKKYIDLINELNGEDVFENYNIWIRKNQEQHSHTLFIPDYKIEY